MGIGFITGSAGLIGSEAARYFGGKGLDIVGIDNDMRKYFFGEEASTNWSRRSLEATLPNYRHYELDIRDREALESIFRQFGSNLLLVLHTAAQPSHDWAAREPITDFTVNANGTLNLLELTRRYAPEAAFIFTSTNKVYGDRPNYLPFIELETRWELDPNHPYGSEGIPEEMSIDGTLHSLFGASKVAADILVQEYGRYFGLKTACFRGGCLTGPGHSGTQLHGFLAYLAKCALLGAPYTVFGYGGKQVRDNIHSLDLVDAFWQVFESPRTGEVYNIGGSRFSNCSMLEAISLCEKFTGRPMNWCYDPVNRVGDHKWWISDINKFKSHYPGWKLTHTIEEIIEEILDALPARLDRRAQGRS